MSRAGSVLEAYWNPNSYGKYEQWILLLLSSDTKKNVFLSLVFSGTPLNSSMIQFQTEHGELDLESADELGTHGNISCSKTKFDALDCSSARPLPVAPILFSLRNTDSPTNTMNGWFFSEIFGCWWTLHRNFLLLFLKFSSIFFIVWFCFLDSGLSLTTVRDATEIESDRESKQNSSLILKNSKANRSIVGKRNNHESDSDDVFAEVRSWNNWKWKLIQSISLSELNRSWKFQTFFTTKIDEKCSFIDQINSANRSFDFTENFKWNQSSTRIIRIESSVRVNFKYHRL